MSPSGCVFTEWVEAPPTGHEVLTHDEARAKVKEMSAIVARWMDSDAWVPWSPPTSEDEQRLRDRPGSMRPEIEANEARVRGQYTTAHKARSLGKETFHPSKFQETAIAVMRSFDWAADTDEEFISELVVTAVDNDHAVGLGQLNIFQRVKRPGISTVKYPPGLHSNEHSVGLQTLHDLLGGLGRSHCEPQVLADRLDQLGALRGRC